MCVLNEYPECLSLLSVYDFPSNVRPYMCSQLAPLTMRPPRYVCP